MNRLAGIVVVFTLLGVAPAVAGPPRVQVIHDVERGLEFGLQAGLIHDFLPPVPDAGPGLLVGLELGWDINWLLRLKGGVVTAYYDASGTLPGGQGVKLDWDSQLYWLGASFSLVASERFHADVQAGVGYFHAGPKQVGNFSVAGSDDVAIRAGGALEYFTGLRHFSLALEVMVDILPGRGDVALAVYPVVRYSFGFGGSRSIEQPRDRDADGVPDKFDRCPDVWGPQSNHGCPEADSDSDGVIDREDHCPQQPGPAANAGCPPEPDSDGDGVKDKLDRCPRVPGPASQDGCPDKDDDGVPDHLDKCPDKKGKVEADGCPSRAHIKVVVRKQSIQLKEKIHFEFGKAKIQRRSYPLLDQVAATLKAHPEIKKLRIEGHTDSRGSAAYNQRLSQRRAQAVVNYLVRRNIARDRLVAKGFGESRPIASNKTAKGRAQNRRVEMIILERE